MNPGIIYLVINPAMPGLVKIGITNQEDVQTRLAQLYTTGVPVPFECVYAASVNDPARVEMALHAAFGPHRLNPRREFFEIEVGQAIGIIKLLEIEDVTPRVKAQHSDISEVEREAGEMLTKRRPRMNYLQMNIPLGSEIICKSNGAVATILTDRSVQYNGEEMSLTAATRLALGYDYNIAPAPYWSYNGVSMQEIYDRTYIRIS